MNNDHRDNLNEQELAEETLRVLDGGQCDSDQDFRTHELGKLLKQSASSGMPESDDGLRQMLLDELDADAVSLAPSKKFASKPVDRIGRRRMWLALPAAAGLIAVGGFWLFPPKFGVELNGGARNVAVELSDFESRDEAVKRQTNIEPAAIPARGGELRGLSSYEDVEFVIAESQNGSVNIGGAIDSNTGKPVAIDSSDTMTKLPKLATTTKSSVVSVPDGGTFIGGIKLENGQKNEQLNFAIQLGRQQQGKGQQQQGEGQSQQGQGQQQQRNGKGEQTGQGPGQQGRGFATYHRYVPAPVRYTPQIVARGRVEGLSRYKAKSDQLDSFGVTFVEPNDGYFEGESESLSKRFEFESKNREQYAPIYENQFVQAAGGAAVSTFSIDVDTASYANMRRFLNSNQMPPRDSIRIEELVNYFQYDYPQPKGVDPFSVNMELATCPWNETHKLLRVGLKGKEVHVKERPATNVVYLIDVSGSMNSNDKLPLLKRGFQMMTRQLGENDRVSIVTYAGNAGVALEPTTGDKTKTINEAIERLASGGSTHGSAGIELAYKLAQQHFITGGVNKVILATDGDLNVGVTDDDSLVKLIKQKASEGVFLTVLGFGTGNLQDGKLEKLADNGNGHYAYLDSNREAHRVLVQQLSGSLVTIAKDVKIQIEFNPAEVKSYRLIGYENRMLATKDFDDDRKDAGEIGAGHTVTAIYEIEPTGGVAAAFTAPAGMKYQLPGAAVPSQQGDEDKLSRLSGAAATGELATLALRYKKPDENESKRIEFAIKNDDKSFTSASDDFRFAASVAGFGMLLRGSEHAGTSTPAMILKMASESTGDDASGYRAEFLDLVRKIVPKDQLFEATFNRGDAVGIALGGFFDVDGDGVSDLEKLKRMIVRNGGRVVAFHDDDGNVTGEIGATTRFFVLGPSPRSGSRKVFETMAKLKEQAEANSVEIIDVRKLLNWTGIHGSGKIGRMDSRIGESKEFESRSPAKK